MFKKLTNDMAVFDLETTGTNLDSDKITEIAFIIYKTDGSVIEKQKYIDPEIDIHPEASEATGITAEFLKEQNALPFRRYAKAIFSLLDGCDLAGYNIRKFDIPILIKEFARCGITYDPSKIRVFDGCSIMKKMESRTLEAAMKFYCNEEIADAHTALGDVKSTVKVMRKQIEYYEELTEDMDELHEFCKFRPDQIDFEGKCEWIGGMPCLTFGKHKGKSLQEMVASSDGQGFLRWVLTKDFMDDFKLIVSEALNGNFPEYTKRD